MRISGLSIKSLRNHRETELEFNVGLNVFYGFNGSGKTSILEGLSICAFSKSFLPCSDSSLIRSGDDFYYASAQARNDLDIQYKVSIKYSVGLRKQINSTFGDNMLPKDIIGEIPTVILSPDYKAITFGAPEDRRQFIDRILSQSGRLYIDELMKYKRALKQRNSLLSRAKSDRCFDFSQLEPWTDVLVNSGAEIIFRRNRFIEDFALKFAEVYENVSDGKELVSLKYAPNGFDDSIETKSFSKDDIIVHLKDKFNKSKDIELHRGTTIYGPQKDDLMIFINSGIAKDHASQGQHKSLLISLKFAEFNFLKEKKNETPIILLDDIFSELDQKRIQKVFEIIDNNSAQTFITLTDNNQVKDSLRPVSSWSFFKVEDGKAFIDNTNN